MRVHRTKGQLRRIDSTSAIAVQVDCRLSERKAACSLNSIKWNLIYASCSSTLVKQKVCFTLRLRSTAWKFFDWTPEISVFRFQICSLAAFPLFECRKIKRSQNAKRNEKIHIRVPKSANTPALFATFGYNFRLTRFLSFSTHKHLLVKWVNAINIEAKMLPLLLSPQQKN